MSTYTWNLRVEQCSQWDNGVCTSSRVEWRPQTSCAEWECKEGYVSVGKRCVTPEKAERLRQEREDPVATVIPYTEYPTWPACAEGEASACEQVLERRSQGRFVGYTKKNAFPEHQEHVEQILRDDWEARCAAGDQDVCSKLARAYSGEGDFAFQTLADPARHCELSASLCSTDGHGPACLDALECGGAEDVDAAVAAVVDGCGRSSPIDECFYATHGLMSAQDDTVPYRPEAAVEMLEALCDRDDERSCYHAWGYYRGGQHAPIDDRRAKAYVGAACDYVGTDCLRGRPFPLRRWPDEVSPHEAELLRRCNDEGDIEACTIGHQMQAVRELAPGKRADGTSARFDDPWSVIQEQCATTWTPACEAGLDYLLTAREEWLRSKGGSTRWADEVRARCASLPQSRACRRL